MQLWLGVKNFAKIESAKICIDQYTLLVGQNNSGKTFLMQLVQGVSQKIFDWIDEDIAGIIQVEEVEYTKYRITNTNVSEIVDYLNKKLEIVKKDIVKEIFGKDISIEELYVDIVMEEHISHEVIVFNTAQFDMKYIMQKENLDLDFLSEKRLEHYQNARISIYSKIQKNIEKSVISARIEQYISKLDDLNISFLKNTLNSIIGGNSLFLPASRTGLLHLYRDFFANKADDAISYKIREDKIVENKERYGGFTQPMYEFLRFLQTYSESDEMKKIYQKELQFFEEKLIEGQISVNEQGKFSYFSKEEEQGVPMHLASSMINEIAPIELSLIYEQKYERLIIDEVEASLHPEKQLELVRFLNRLNNKGMKLIVSTHSDTFVSKLNNLYSLSKYVNNEEFDLILKKFNLEKEDVINAKQLFVYEFVLQPNGKSVVKEILPGEKGYQFDLFTNSAMQIYEEALKLGEIQ